MLESRIRNERYGARSAVAVFVMVLLSPVAAPAADEVVVDVYDLVNSTASHPVGINVNFLMDDSVLDASRDTTQALADMGVKFLRYPGGEKSDTYLWSLPPWTAPFPIPARFGPNEWPSNDPRFAEDYVRFRQDTLDFDEFMTMCQAIDCEPLIVVAYDSMYGDPSPAVTTPSRELLLLNAEEWVRYANVIRDYGIRYWMIGNESWNEDDYGGVTPEQYRDDVIEFSQRMKGVDPSIEIVINGEGSDWWSTVLPAASASIDYLGVSSYPVWDWPGGYEHYRTQLPDLLGEVRTAKDAIQNHAPAPDRDRLKIIATELGSMDWAGTWPDANDLGHALVAFEAMGQHLMEDSVEFTQFWTTRWVNASVEIYDALDDDGQFNASGRAMAIWGNFLLRDLVFADSSTSTVRAFATLDPVSWKLNVFLLNKDTSSRTVDVLLGSYATWATGVRWEMGGIGPDDTSPTWGPAGTVFAANGTLTATLPPVSITVLELQPSDAPLDLDGDGVDVAGGDCDDGDPQVFPGNAEWCDGRDNNCDGRIDEDAIGLDSDRDGVPNACDSCTDLDRDGLGDPGHEANVCPPDGCPFDYNPLQRDSEGDGVQDACDVCPDVVDPEQLDIDRDRRGNACDNCPLDPNGAQMDFDGDGEGDLCDRNDGVLYLSFTSPSAVRWHGESFSSWNLYRGNLAVLRNGGQYIQALGSGPLVARACGLAIARRSDSFVPGVSETVFYLATGSTLGEESGLGQDSAGRNRPYSAAACP